jgi:hypothetical protein
MAAVMAVMRTRLHPPSIRTLIRPFGWLGAATALVIIAACQPPPPAVEGDSSVRILAPAPGQLIRGDRVEVHYALVRGVADGGDHVHVWLDSENEGFSIESPKRLLGVRPGSHTVRVRVATGDHHFPGPEASVQFVTE